jgi:hypothetical protein
MVNSLGSRAARVLAALALVSIACAPTLEDRTTIVSEPVVLAVQATPAEAALGASFAMNALYVDPQGARAPSGLDWAMCLRQKALGDPGPIDPGCFADAAPGLLPIGAGGSVQGRIPADACQLFGPDSSPPQPGQPSARPTDPDGTGGYYLPVRLKSPEGQWYAAVERLACQPSGVTQAVFGAFTDGYRPNSNPTIAGLSFDADADADADKRTTATAPTPIAPDGAVPGPGATVRRGERLTLQVSWPDCPGADPCGGAESYIAIDPTSKAIDSRRESMVASWYATAGGFDVDRSGRAESDRATSAANGWTAPSSPGTVHLWVVLRDSRGGVGWGSFTLAVD